ncbi:MAG TPA: hypothetical protein VI731_09190 [Bacteroidia bacterium]|nr:hypothetical protein [Bacteroidia bacterium]
MQTTGLKNPGDFPFSEKTGPKQAFLRTFDLQAPTVPDKAEPSLQRRFAFRKTGNSELTGIEKGVNCGMFDGGLKMEFDSLRLHPSFLQIQKCQGHTL